MSLFKVREWWGTSHGKEEFDCGSLCADSFGSSGNTTVIVGSLSGIIRLYEPQAMGYKAEHLILEEDLGEPILQLKLGNFITGQPSYDANGRLTKSLAVLHPSKLVVYRLVAPEEEEDSRHGPSYYSLKICYEHRLDRSPANFTSGPFGASHNFEYIAVQSLDGQVGIYENESHAFSRFLPDVLVPGPFCYFPVTDSFITSGSNFEVQSFKFTALASASDSKPHNNQLPPIENDNDKENQGGFYQSKRVHADWSCIIGEFALDIQVGNISSIQDGGADTDIVVLGETMLFTLSDVGHIRSQRKLDYVPLCMALYPSGRGGGGRGSYHNSLTSRSTKDTMNLIIGSNTGSVMIYKDLKLVWAAKCDFPTIGLCVASFGQVEGLIDRLGEMGKLCVDYLGTDPPASVTSTMEVKELDYEEMDREHRKLLTKIRDSTSSNKTEQGSKMTIRAEVPSRLDVSQTSNPFDNDKQNRRSVTVALYMTNAGSEPVDNVSVSCSCTAPFVLQDDNFTIATVGSTPGKDDSVQLDVQVWFEADEQMIPSDSTLRVIAVYTTSHGEPRCSECLVSLPVILYMNALPPMKTDGFKLTLETNRQPPSLLALYDDLVREPGAEVDADAAGGGNALTLQYLRGPEVTILVSKSAGRYRIQSAVFEALWLVLHELYKRLTEYFATKSSGDPEPFKVSYNDNIPLQDLFSLIDRHFACRQQLQKLRESMSMRATQFRSIQKRLLVRFKDKNPVTLENLDTLLTDTFQDMRKLSEEATLTEKKLMLMKSNLSAGSQIIVFLLKLQFNLDAATYTAICGALPPPLSTALTSSAIDWEEHSDSALTYLLRTTLIKTNAQGGTMISPATINALTDTERLKRKIGVLCERLTQGVRVGEVKQDT